jgi:hypothetical protein
MQLLQDLLGLFKRDLYIKSPSLKDAIPIMKTRGLPKNMINTRDNEIRPDIHLVTLEDFINVIPSVESGFQTLSGGDGSKNIDWNYSLGYNAKVTLSGVPGVRTLNAPTNVSNGDYGTLVIDNGLFPGMSLVVPASFKVVNNGGGVVTISGTAGAIDAISWVYDGTNFLITEGLNFT